MTITASAKANVKSRFDGLCGYCGIRNAGTVDHVIAQINGGDNKQANLMPCCGVCNRAKDSRSTEGFRRALLSRVKRRKCWGYANVSKTRKQIDALYPMSWEGVFYFERNDTRENSIDS